MLASTARPGADAELGGFGGFFDLRAAGYWIRCWSPPTTASAPSSSSRSNRASWGVGIDLVAMCANDLIVQGAEPLFFLDYYATGKLDNAVAAAVVASIAEGCRQAGCALIGGETAEMPGMYAAGDYDLAGFCVGAVERGKVLTGDDIAPGDLILGLASSGVHSNGFSLVRRIIDQELGSRASSLPRRRTHAWRSTARADPDLRPLAAAGGSGATINGLAHITGGGLLENIPRVLPDNCHAS